ncbi:unnamed protein product [Adineta ricciae]|uniref:Uncharacterized protein n=1 Tax=Adineta ricciae TaxID=249248 RepID=A0A815AIF4_ADIRI|nr:unnamed protein product [Adineta ricciae]CAF1509959.1 unnamed protein product [Adineta ricciae]
MLNSCSYMSMLLVNVASLGKYLAEVFELIQSTFPPIIILKGTYHKDNIAKRFTSHFFSHNVITSKGSNDFRGVLIAIHKSIECRRHDEFNGVNNLIVLEVGMGNKTFQLVSCYSPPNEKLSFDTFDSILDANSIKSTYRLLENLEATD